MKKNNGYTFLELMMTVALIAIFSSLLLPLMTAYTNSHQKMNEINKIDLELSKTVDLVKRSIRFAQADSSTSYSAIVHPSDDATTSSTLTVVIQEEDVHNYVTFWIENNEFKVVSTITPGVTKTGGSVLMTDVEIAEFKHSENIVAMYFRLSKDGLTREIRDAGVTRVNYQVTR